MRIDAKLPCHKDEATGADRAWGALVLAWFVGLLTTTAGFVVSVLKRLLGDDDDE